MADRMAHMGTKTAQWMFDGSKTAKVTGGNLAILADWDVVNARPVHDSEKEHVVDRLGNCISTLVHKLYSHHQVVYPNLTRSTRCLITRVLARYMVLWHRG